MRVSVIIPTYNYGTFIREAIESVQRQTLEDIEIIVVDDGSTDDTPAVLASISDPRLRVWRAPNGGRSVARNIGLEMARGDFIAFLDADDRWRPRKLERQVAMMEREPSLAAVFTDFVRFDDSQIYPKPQFAFYPELNVVPSREAGSGKARIITGDAFATLLSFNHFPAWLQTLMLRRELVRDIQFPEDVGLSQDMYFMLRVYQQGLAGFISEPLVEVRRHGGNSYSALLEKLHADLNVLRRFQREPLSKPRKAALRRKIGSAWSSLGYYHFNTRSPVRAGNAYGRALMYPGRRRSAVQHLAALPAVPFLSTSAKVDWSEPSEEA